MDDVDPMRSRLEILGALAVACDRRAQVLTIVETAVSDEAAAAALVERLGITPLGADAVLSMQVRRFTPEAREEIRRERDEIRASMRRADWRDGDDAR